MLKLENIKGGYAKGCQILQGIDLQIKPGEVVGIIGLNGSGKSTLGKAIMNMIPFRSGQLTMNGEDISRLPVHQVQKAGISMVMQGGRVFSNMTVLEHLQFANNQLSEVILISRMKEIYERFGLEIYSLRKSNRKASYLSGGEKQQLVLMMALLNQPELLILDEISAGLSPANQTRVIDSILKMKESNSISIILIEQNIKMATQLSDRLLILERGVIDQQFLIDNTFNINSLNINIFN